MSDDEKKLVKALLEFYELGETGCWCKQFINYQICGFCQLRERIGNMEAATFKKLAETIK